MVNGKDLLNFSKFLKVLDWQNFIKHLSRCSTAGKLIKKKNAWILCRKVIHLPKWFQALTAKWLVCCPYRL